MSNKVQCGLCHYEFDHGVRVCQGCQGTVVYGATNAEANESAKVHGVLYGGAALFLIYALPILLNTELGWKVPLGWGMGYWGFVVVAIAGLWGLNHGYGKASMARHGQIRTFR